jgi:hypothetical protein
MPCARDAVHLAAVCTTRRRCRAGPTHPRVLPNRGFFLSLSLKHPRVAARGCGRLSHDLTGRVLHTAPATGRHAAAAEILLLHTRRTHLHHVVEQSIHGALTCIMLLNNLYTARSSLRCASVRSRLRTCDHATRNQGWFATQQTSGPPASGCTRAHKEAGWRGPAVVQGCCCKLATLATY